MSVELVVYLPQAALPSSTDWQRAIREVGFSVELGHEFDPVTFTGYLPCQYRGGASGFEYFTRKLTAQDQAALDVPDGMDFAVTLVTHADLREYACSLAAACALCRTSGGVILDPQAGESHPAGRVASWAAEQLADLEQELP